MGLFAAGLVGCAAANRSVAAPAATEAVTTTSERRFVDSLLGQMTLAEKLGQLNQLSGPGDPTGPGGRAARSTLAGSQLLASANGTGKIVRSP